MYAYFLSENETSDINVATHAPDCPEALTALLRVMRHVYSDAHPLLSHPLAHTTKAPAPLKAYGLLARKAATVAREYWQTRGC